MKKLLILFALLMGTFAYSQVSLAKVLKLVEITTAQRDGLTIAANEFPVIYNSTTSQFERYNGSTWETFVGGESITESQISDLSHTTTLPGLSDVVSATNTNRFGLMANGTTGYVGRALVEADISDLTHTPATTSIVGITGTSAQFNTANTDDNFALLGAFNTFALDQTMSGSLIIGGSNYLNGTLFLSTETVTEAGWGIGTADNVTNNLRFTKNTSGNPNSFATVYTLDATGTPTIATDLVDKAYADAIAGAPEGTAVKSTGETLGTKFLREDGDGTSSWQVLTGGGDALQSSPLSQFAATTSAQFASVISNETGTGSVVLATSPTLVTPVLGAATATTINGATITSGTLNGSVTGTNTGDQSSIVGITGTLAQFNTAISDGSIGTGDALVANPLSQFAATTSAQLQGIISDDAGSGSLLFGSGTNTGDQTSIVGITGTSAEFNTANTSGSFAFLDEANTFTLNQTIDGSLVLNGSTSGTTTIQAPAVAGTTTITLPSATGTLMNLNGDYGTPSALVLTNASGLTTTGIINGTIVNADIADDTIGEAKLDIFNAPTDGYVLTYDTTNNIQWEASAVGIALHPNSDVQIDSIYVGTTAQIAARPLGSDVLAFPTDNVDTLFIEVPLTDFVTVPTASTSVAKYTWRAPYDLTIKDIRGSVATAGTTSAITMDVHDSGTTIMTTNKLTIDATEKTSTTAATAAVVTDSLITDDAELTFFIDAVDSGGTGLGYALKLYYTKGQ